MSQIVKAPSANPRRRAGVERQVLAALNRLLADGTSFTDLPTQRVADEANLARSTMYLYFEDKSQLLIRAADEATSGIFEAAEHWVLTDHADGEAGAVKAMGQMIATFREHRLLLRAIGEVSAYDRSVARYWLGRIQPFIDLLRGRLQELQKAGLISPAVQPDATAHVLVWMCERAISHHFGSGEPAQRSDNRLAAALGRSVWLTIYGDASSKAPAS